MKKKIKSDKSPENSCHRKQPYDTHRQAKDSIVHTRRIRKDRAVMQAYKCKYCGFWHIGRQVGKRR